MSAEALYKSIVLDHHRNPRRYGAIDGATHRADGVNPLCGDRLAFELRCIDGRVTALGFTGEACAITTATASMLGALVEGRDAAEFDGLRQRFATWLAAPSVAVAQAPGAESSEAVRDTALGELLALAELRHHRARHPCAMLPFETIAAALASRDTATTEGS